ncbi:hypothetical protein, partial [Streptomyces sp. NPDC047981]|uniref:hypothetical protein n=1 Tax=Streptomyces sp. NPDC047981 TaxID=3154610 RepID=UPI003436C19E
VVVHDPRPSSKQTREKDEQILAGINAAPAGSNADTARHMNMDPQTLHKWLQSRTSQLGLDSGTTRAQTLRYIRDHKDAVAVGMIGKRANDLAPYETPCPKLLDERDKQVIATLLHHPTLNITDIANEYRHPKQTLQNWVERLGKNLRVDVTAGEVVTYVRDNPDTVLTLAGLTSSDIATLTIPSGKVAGPTPRDKQVIATLLHHPTLNITDLAKKYRHPEWALTQWVGELGRSLRVPGAAGEVMAHVRDNPDEALRQAGLTSSDIATLTIPTGEVAGPTERDKQVIVTLLRHPTFNITDIANEYRQPQPTLQKWVAGLGQSLRLDVKARQVASYVRDNQDTVLTQAGLDSSDITTLPAIPFGEVAGLTPRDKQVIVTLLRHPALNITDIANEYRQPQPTLQKWVAGLGQSLRLDVKARQVASYVRDNRDEVLAQAGLGKDITTLPPIPKGKK